MIFDESSILQEEEKKEEPMYDLRNINSVFDKFNKFVHWEFNPNPDKKFLKKRQNLTYDPSHIKKNKS